MSTSKFQQEEMASRKKRVRLEEAIDSALNSDNIGFNTSVQ